MKDNMQISKDIELNVDDLIKLLQKGNYDTKYKFMTNACYDKNHASVFDFGLCFASVIHLINTMKNEYIKQCNPIIAKELDTVLVKLNEIQIKSM